MDELMKKLAAKGGEKKLSEQEAKAKLAVIEELLSMAQDAMADGVKSDMDSVLSPKASVEVSADDPESLAEGLDLAKDMVEEQPELEKAEELLGKDLDGDMEEGESEEHKEAVLGDEEDEEDEEEEEKPKRSFPGLL